MKPAKTSSKNPLTNPYRLERAKRVKDYISKLPPMSHAELKTQAERLKSTTPNQN